MRTDDVKATAMMIFIISIEFMLIGIKDSSLLCFIFGVIMFFSSGGVRAKMLNQDRALSYTMMLAGIELLLVGIRDTMLLYAGPGCALIAISIGWYLWTDLVNVSEEDSKKGGEDSGESVE